VVLGDDERQLVGPGFPTRLPQPCVLRLDRRGEVVECVEGGKVVESRGDGQLLVAVRRGRSHGAGEVHDAIRVRLVGVEARVVTTSTMTVRFEDLLDERQRAKDLLGRHRMDGTAALVTR
jgi:hypothetical protein